MKLLRWFASQTAGFYLNMTGLVLLLGMASAAQTTSWDVHNLPQMYLNSSITNTQTSSITISALQRNGVSVTFPTTTGGVLRIRAGSRVEDISYTSATVNATTKIVTLSGVTRNLCWNQSAVLQSCGNGQYFSKGATVELSQDARLFNFKANQDRPNTFTASGSIRFSGSGSFAPPTFATTAERDAQLGAAGSQIRMACVTGTGACYLRLGGTWTQIGDTGTSNATTTTSGKVEVATVADNSGATVLGDSGAPVAITTDLVIRRSTGAINNRNKIVATNNDGRISGSLLSQLPLNKFNNGTNASNTTFWRGDGTWASPGPRVLFAAASGSNVIASSASEVDFSKTLTLTGGTIGTGGTIKLYASGLSRNGGGSASPKFRIYLGATLVATLTGANVNLANTNFEINASISLRKYQTTGHVQVNSKLDYPQPAGTTFNQGVKHDRFNTTNFNIVNNPVLKISGQMGNSDANNTLQLDQFTVEYLPPT